MTANSQPSNGAGATKVLKAIAHPVRIRILTELCEGAKCVKTVQKLIDVSQPNLSQHLSVLKEAALVGSHACGPMRCYYLLAPTFVKKMIALLGKGVLPKERGHQAVVREAARNHRKVFE